jgi:transposase
MKEVSEASMERFIGLDVHKHYAVACAVNARKEVLLGPVRVEFSRWPQWIAGNVQASDAVVLEATTNAWPLYDQLAPLAGRVVAHAGKIAGIADARVKTDGRAALHLAKLLAADMIPAVWVPPVPVRELRALLAHRRRLVKMRRMTRNRLHSLIHRYSLVPPRGEIFSPKHRAWWEELELSPTERLRVRQDLALLDALAPQVQEVAAELQRLSTVAPWSQDVPYLLQLPGFGLIVVMTILAAIGDITRFPHPKQLVGYAGLGASVKDSGESNRRGRITKEGRRERRFILVEAARIAVLYHPYWKAQYARLERRLGTNKAIVAIARKLLVVVWHVLTERAADRQAEPEMVAFKLMVWSWELDDTQRGGLSTRQFVRYHLLQLQLGADLTHVHRGGRNRGIAPAEEVLELRPELRAELTPAG